MTLKKYKAVRIIITPKAVQLIGLGRSARGSTFNKRAVTIPRKDKAKDAIKSDIAEGVKQLMAETP